MKKFLFGTSALAVAAIAGPSFASDVELSLGGYLRGGVGFISEDPESSGGSGDGEVILIRDGEIHFRGSGTLDNGISISGRVELEAFGTGDQIDENWLSVGSSFGMVMIGGNDDAFNQVGYVGFTSTFVNHAVTDGTLDFTPAPIGTAAGASDSIAIHYYTPTIAGFQAGITYQPRTDTDGGGDGIAVVGNDGPGENTIAIGAAYRNSFGDFDFAIGGGYRTDDDDVQDYLIGVEVGFSGFQVNGRYDVRDLDGEEITVYAVGGNYSTGPWTFGAGYANQDGEDAGSFDGQRISAGVDYALGDGVTAGAGIEWGDNDTTNEDAIYGALLLGVSF